MAHSTATYHSKVYLEFRAIEATDYRKIVHFYEKQEDAILQLDFEEYFELLTAYVHALFEAGTYHRHVQIVDVVIETAIEHNIIFYKGEDIFLTMLFRKAASLYNLFEYERAEYILREIIKIHPWYTDAIQFLKKCLNRRQPRYVQVCRAASVALFLLGTALFIVDILWIQHFLQQYAGTGRAIRFASFGMGATLLVGADLLCRLQVERHVYQFVMTQRRQKDCN